MTSFNAIARRTVDTLQRFKASGVTVPAGHGPGVARWVPELATDLRPSALASSATVDRNDHVAAAAYLMRHHSATALLVLDGNRFSHPVWIITETDISQAAAEGKDLDEVRIQQLMSQSAGRNQRGGKHP